MDGHDTTREIPGFSWAVTTAHKYDEKISWTITELDGHDTTREIPGFARREIPSGFQLGQFRFCSLFDEFPV